MRARAWASPPRSRSASRSKVDNISSIRFSRSTATPRGFAAAAASDCRMLASVASNSRFLRSRMMLKSIFQTSGSLA